MKPKEERKQLQNELMAIYESVKAELMQIPGVCAVSVGLKKTGGKLTDDIVFQVYVKQKIGEEQLRPEEIIPKEIRGYKTDVLLLPKGGKRIDNNEHRPLKGGIQIGIGDGGVGTLGWFGRLADGTRVLLTNRHVLYGENTSPGDKVGQPDYEHHCCCCCAYTEGEIGVILNPGLDNDLVDCALASINNSVAIDLIVNNAMTSTEIRVTGTDSAVAGELVRKIGRTSGLTNGTVFSINAPCLDEEGNTIREGQIHIHPVPSETYTLEDNGKKAFSDGGDSGSIIINESGEIIGLLWGGDPDTGEVDITWACHIRDVLSELANAGLALTLDTTPADRSGRKPKQVQQAPRLDHDIRRHLLETDKGRVLVELFEKHRHEVLQLINRNRAVMVAWQRYEGPAFAVHFANSARDPLYEIPAAVRQTSLQELLLRMSAVLKEAGSENLRQDLQIHALDIIHDSYGIQSLQDLIDKTADTPLAQA